MAAKVYNHTTKQWEFLADDKVDEKIRAGTHTFATGITIPTVSEDGRIVDIPSENLHAAFNDGYRWLTPADLQADIERKQAASKERISGDQPLASFAAGALNTITLGGVDAGIRLAEEAGALPEGVTQANADTKELNPKMRVTGAIAGAFIPLPIKGGSVAGAGNKLGTAAGNVVSKAPTLGGAVQGAAQLTKAQRAIRGVASGALAGGAEGAFYGLGEGISEAALDENPDKIVDHLVSGVSFGALTGGAMGSAFGVAGVAKPFLQSAAEKAATGTAALVNRAVRKSIKEVGKAVLSVTESRQIARDFADLVDDDAFQQIAKTGDMQSMKAYARLARAETQQLEREGKRIVKDLHDEVDQADVAVQQDVLDRMAANKGDLERARIDVYENVIKPAGQAFDDLAEKSTGPALAADQWVDDFGALIDDMMDSGYPALKAKGIELKQFITSRSKLDDAGNISMTQGDEMHTLKYIKQTLFDRDALADLKLTGQAYRIAREVQDTAKTYLYNYPDTALAESFQAYDKAYHSYKVFDRVAKKHKGMTFVQPEAVRELAPVLRDVESLAPEISRVRASVGDTVAHAEAMSALVTKARETHGAIVLNDPVTLQAFKDIIGEVAKKPVNTARLTQISETLSGLDQLTPMEQAVRLQKALGKDTSGIEKFLPFQEQMRKLESLRKVQAGDATTMRGLTRVAVGGSLGGIPGAVAAGATSIAAHPARIITTVLPAIKKASDAGAKRLTQSFKLVTDTLTSGKARSAALIGRSRSESMKEKRERFPKVMRAVSTNMTPQGAIASITEMSGNTPELGKLKGAMSNRLQVASLYLDQKAPKDPMAGKSILIQDSNWEPSDVELATFMRRVAVVNDPTVAIDKLAEGTVTLEEIDALKMVHPEIYANLQRKVVDAIIDNGKAIPYQTRLLLGTVFGLPTDYSMTPEFIGRMQATYAPKDQGGRPEGSTEGVASTQRKKNIDVSPFSTVQTEVSRLTYGTET